jgi:hypothetical protein
MIVSFVVLLAKVGDPLRLLGVLAFSSATTSLFTSLFMSLLGFAPPLLALFLLLLSLFLLLRLSLLFFLDLLGVFAESITNVLLRKVALLWPHMIVRDAAKSKSENAERVIVETTNSHE